MSPPSTVVHTHNNDDFSDETRLQSPSTSSEQIDHLHVDRGREGLYGAIRVHSTVEDLEMPDSSGRSVLENETLKAVNQLKNEHGLRAHAGTVTKIPDSSQAPIKKRPAPKSVKKGQAVKRPPAKKRKLEIDTVDANVGQGNQQSGTPTTRTPKTITAKNKKSQSGTPIGSSPVPHDRSSVTLVSDMEDSDSEEDDTLYCVCRGKDDHTWMIGCEACDDWFHGRCVNLKKEEHEALLAKFICPNCQASGKGFTTWKPMCRRAGCSNPAEITTKTQVTVEKKIDSIEVSKFCSKECGTNFFKNITSGVKHMIISKNPPFKRGAVARRKANRTDNITNSDNYSFDEEDIEPPPRGGVIRAKDLKALVSACNTVEDFHKLGNDVLSPTISAPYKSDTFGDENKKADDKSDVPYTLTADERDRLKCMAIEEDILKEKRAFIKDRERLIGLVRDQANKYAEREGLKPKDVCGYDTRLAWSEPEFREWQHSAIGQVCLAANTLEPSQGDFAKVNENNLSSSPKADNTFIDEVSMQTDFCTRKRCDRHKQWERLHQQELRFEEVAVLQAMRGLEVEEKDIRQRALIRYRRDKAMEELADGGTNIKSHGEGWVEAIDP
jgi:COMPASS component SPP1